MKLFWFSLAALALFVNAANAAIIAENFDEPGGFFGTTGMAGNLPSVPVVAGWVVVNNSTPGGTTSWHSNTGSTPFAPQAGTGYAAVDKNSTTGQNTISNWLITPQFSFSAGDQVTFWTRTTAPPIDFPDRLQLRLSTAGASTNVGTTATSFGDFSTLLLDINPNLTAAGYPTAWTLFTASMPTTGSGRLAFRYFATNAGPSGTNGNFIGIDTFAVNVVPEPAALGLAGIVAVSGLARRRIARAGSSISN